ncbi:S8 family serine peptidase [Actinoplanes sp. CA-054009]
MHLPSRRAAAATAVAALLLTAPATPARAAAPIQSPTGLAATGPLGSINSLGSGGALGDSGAADSPVAFESGGAAALSPGGTTARVTLITGDVVTIRGRTVSTDASARIIETKSGVYVYPTTALPYVAAGALDRDLFNVTQLVADRYDDAHTDRLPLIVSYRDGTSMRAAPLAGAVRVRALEAVQGEALTRNRAQAKEFWSSLTAGSDSAKAGRAAPGTLGGGVEKVWLDGRVRADLADTTAQINAPRVWQGENTGAGVTVAVLDTGVDTSHPDFAGRIGGSASFVPGQDVLDRFGHGTHVASTIAGTGAASGGLERGVAPGARLDIGKVLGDDGTGQDSWIIAGMQWAAVERGAKIINMSLGNPSATDGSDPLSEAVDELSRETGALFVVAAGNSGGTATIGAPGAADAALTVGAVDRDDRLAYFSSQGPRLGDQAVKPEITAPGVDVLAARSQLTEGEGAYTTMSGTSMATPHVAGAAALVLAAHPDWTGQRLKDALVSTSTATPELSAFQGGAGRLDAAAAVSASVFATGAVSAGAKAITYTNTGATAATLALTGPAGVTLTPGRVTVPARGTADVAVSWNDTSVTRSGQVTAADSTGRVVARTAVGTGPVMPYHRMTLKLRDRAGEPAGGIVELMGEDNSWEPMFVPIDGEVSLMLPEGYYSALSFVEVPGAHGPSSLGLALIGDPEVRLAGDLTVVLDAAKAKRITTSVPRTTRDTFARLDYYRTMDGDGFYRTYVEAGVAYDSLWAQPAPEKVRKGDFHLTARWRKEVPELSVSSPSHDYDDVLRQAGVTPLADGTLRLRAVDAGDGLPADYARVDARGKVAVVRHVDGISDADQARAAVAAGVRVLLVANDYFGRTRRDYGPSFGARTPIEVGGLSRDEGDRLRAELRRGPVTLTVTAAAASDVVYDLVQTYHDQIPAALAERQTAATLARVPVDFTKPASGEFRFDWPDYNSGWGIGGLSNRPLPRHRTDYVSTSGPYTWGQEAYASGLSYQISERTSYRPGPAAGEVYFAPIARPHLNNNYKAPVRKGDTLSVDIPGFGDDDHVGMTQNAATQTTAIHQGSTLLGQTNGTFLTVPAPPTTQQYRVTVHTEQDPAAGPLSLRTDTEWRFRSTRDGALPLLQLEYQVRGRSLAVSVKDHPCAVTLQVSYDDGRHWTTQPVIRGVAFLHPPRGANYASIRATATDPTGNRVDQTVIRAFPTD